MMEGTTDSTTEKLKKYFMDKSPLVDEIFDRNEIVLSKEDRRSVGSAK